MISGNLSQKFLGFFCSVLLLQFFVLSCAVAQEKVDPAGNDQEDSMSQAQTTLASLFGRGASMPSVPHANGTIALPGFDNSTMTINEDSLPGARKLKTED